MQLVLIDSHGTVVDQTREYTFFIHQLNISRQMIEEAMGYRYERTPAVVAEIIDKILLEIHSLREIRGGFRIISSALVSFNDNGFSCGDIQFVTGWRIASCLRNSAFLAVFVSTAGSYLEKLSKEYIAKGDFITGYVIDTCGSEIAERVTEMLESLIADAASKINMMVTNRYSPGYCGWDVVEQHKFFSLLPQGFCGVALTDSAFMLPIKSVNGVIGIGKDVKTEAHGCASCDIQDCLRRQKTFW